MHALMVLKAAAMDPVGAAAVLPPSTNFSRDSGWIDASAPAAAAATG